jgi:hypothetical protein
MGRIFCRRRGNTKDDVNTKLMVWLNLKCGKMASQPPFIRNDNRHLSPN